VVAATHSSSNMQSVMDHIPPPATVHAEEVESAFESRSPHDSMVTVRLSAPPPALCLDTATALHKAVQQQRMPDTVPEDAETNTQKEKEQSPRITMMDPNGDVVSPSGSESGSETNGESRRGSNDSDTSESEAVNWEELEKTEENEPRDQGSDDVSC
jgi:hypothetical protein